ncbi:MAG: M48 family metalloprotease [Candidatus Omnitrophota bacterium]
MKRLILILLFLTFLSGCATVYNPATRKKEFILIDTRSEVALGQKIDAQIRKEYIVEPDNAAQQRARRLGQDVARACERKGLEYHFLVLRHKGDKEELNAFSTPGGYVYILKDLMDEATDDELVGVIAHEVGHIAAKHAVKRLQASMGYDILMSLAFSKESVVLIKSTMDIVSNLVVLGYSRKDELEADRLAVRYTYKAGYDPYGLVTFMQKLEAEHKDNAPAIINFLRTHPPHSQREELLKEEIVGLSGGGVK